MMTTNHDARGISKIAAGALALVLLMFAGAVSAGAHRPPPGGGPPADPAIATIQNGQPSNKLLVTNADGSNVTAIYNSPSSLDAGPSWSPDGHAIAFVTGGGSLTRIDVAVVNGTPVGSNVQILLARNPGILSFHTPAWSPLGSEIVTVQIESPAGLWVVPAGGGSPAVLYTSPAGRRPWYPAWSRDGTQIAFVEADADAVYHVRLVDRASGAVVTLASPAFASLPRFLDWGRTQDVLTYDWSGGIYTLDLASGSTTPIVSGNFPTWSPDDSRIRFSAGGRLKSIDLGTGSITTLPKAAAGSWPDWRRF
jgi:Tol biopolymer transport system component